MTFRTLVIAALLALLAGCPSPGIRPGVDDQQRWQLSGKLGLRGPQLAESAYLNWRQCGDNYDIRISGPLGQTVARVSGRGEYLTLQFDGRDPVTTATPELLMQEQLGWSVPLRALRYWVRAEPAPGDKPVFSGPTGQPASLDQAGWHIDYLSYHANDKVALPAKLRLSGQQQLQATLIIGEWLLSDAVTDCP